MTLENHNLLQSVRACCLSIFTLLFSPLFYFNLITLNTNGLFLSSPTLKQQTIKPCPVSYITTVIECVGSHSISFCSVEMRIPHCYSPLSARLAQSDNDYILNRHVFEAVVMEQSSSVSNACEACRFSRDSHIIKTAHS